MFNHGKSSKIVGFVLVASLVLSLGLSLSALAYGPEEPITPAGKSVWPKKFPLSQPYSIQTRLRADFERGIELVVPISGSLDEETETMMQYATLIYDVDVGRQLANLVLLASYHTAYPETRLITKLKYPTSQDGINQLMTDLAGGTAPAIYNAQLLGGVQTAANRGLAADLTEYVENWSFKKYLPDTVVAEMQYKGSYYGFPSSRGGWERSLWFREDWFEEAGLFDGEGNPGPPSNWTVTDFREIAQKLTDPKRERWGVTISLEGGKKASSFMAAGGGIYSQFWNYSWGIPLVLPDPSGKNSYVSGIDTAVSIRALQYEHDLIYKYKVALAGVEISWGTGDVVRTNRAGMSFGYDSASWLARHSNSLGNVVQAEKDGEIVEIPFKYIMGAAPLPKGPQGVRLSTIQGADTYWLVNPTLDEEQKLAAFQYLNWLECLQYPFLIGYITEQNRAFRYLYQSEDPYKLPEKVPDITMRAPRFFPVMGTQPWLEEMANYNASSARARAAILEDPTPPQILAYGGFVLGEVDAEDLMQKAAIEVMTNKDADIAAITAKYARLINTGALAYKDEALSKEVLLGYFTDLGEFYKVEFPNYYENVWTKELWPRINVW